MDFNKSEEELRILTDTYHVEIMDNAMEPMGLRYISSEILRDISWDSLLGEPVLQLLYHDADDDIREVDQFFVSSKNRSFSTSENSNDDMLGHMYYIPRSETENLFRLFIIDFLNSADLLPVEDFMKVSNFNLNIIDLMFEIDYFTKYSEEQISELYNLSLDERFLPEAAKDIFLF